MQFGIDKFLEMFERRFGRWLTTILLLLIALGISALMVNLVVQNAVKPIADGVDKLTEGKGIDWRELILQGLITLGLTAIGVILFWQYATWLQGRWKREADSIIQKEGELFRQTQSLSDKVGLDLELTRKVLDDIKRANPEKNEPEGLGDQRSELSS